MRITILASVMALVGCNPGNVPKVQTDVRAYRLQEIHISTKGTLSPLVRHSTWRGDRLRVTGLRYGLPVKEIVGPWWIELYPDPKENTVEVRGLLFAKNLVVTLDLDRDLLVIDGEEFKGRKITGTSPMYGEAPFQGLVFERQEGKVTGKASILFLEDGRVSMDFDKVHVGDIRAREYGALSGVGQ